MLYLRDVTLLLGLDGASILLSVFRAATIATSLYTSGSSHFTAALCYGDLEAFVEAEPVLHISYEFGQAKVNSF